MNKTLANIYFNSNFIFSCFIILASFSMNLLAEDKLLIEGREIYQNGRLPNGDNVTAIVAGDVPINGSQFSCENCHGRSGMGATEGNYVVPSVIGDFLFTQKHQTKRPNYTVKSLKKALVDGIDFSGNPFDPLMPRYILSDSNVEALAIYLKSLSSRIQPGLHDNAIHLSTVVTEDIDPTARKAILDVLQKFASEKNRQTRLESKRPNRGLRPEIRLPTLFRPWKLDVWTLKGDRKTWQSQLQNYYDNDPVFAMIGGLSSGSWDPIGQFCEKNKLPCLFPTTKLANSQPNDWYSIHFSKGLELEANILAKHFVKNKRNHIIQVYCSKIASKAASILSANLEKNQIKSSHLKFDCADNVPNSKLQTYLKKKPNSPVILWVEKEKLLAMNSSQKINKLYLSSVLLNGDLDDLDGLAFEAFYATYLYRLPGKRDSAMTRFKVWAKLRKIAITHPKLQAEAFFAVFAANDSLEHIRRFRIQDYLLEMLDHSEGLPLYLPSYPRASLGPGQRFLSKGGYILPLINGKADIENAEWVQP
ncbi:MAG: hypothetical protein COA86_10795 [Kangiella sp.]|nr:MAG: hypothetical protein COA86_10795 [Kangiella sp.]